MLKILRPALALVVLTALMIGCSNDPAPLAPGSDSSRARVLQVAASIPADATLDSARFFVYASSVDSQQIDVHEVTSAWTEPAITWTSFGGAFDAAVLASWQVDDTGWYSVDVSSLAQAWFDSTEVNNGFLFEQAGTDSARTVFVSREGDENQPFLQVCYTTYEGEFCDTLDAVADAYIYQAEPDNNFGSDPELLVGAQAGADSVYQALVQFDFPVEIRYGAIGDFVWNDLNGDGLQDDGEPGLAGVMVRLFDCQGNELDSTDTDVNGLYEFDSLATGDYQVGFVLPLNYEFSPMDVGEDDAIDSDADPATGLTECTTLLPGQTNNTIDAGMHKVKTEVGDYVWNDANMNGIQDPDETGLEGIPVSLFTCAGDWVASDTSDADGMYLFSSLNAGDYYLQFENPPGWIFTYMDQGDNDSLDSDVNRYTKKTDCFTLAAGDEDMTWDAGLFEYDGCTHGKGYWKNHTGLGPQGDEVSILLPIWLGDADGAKSVEVTTAQMAFDILQQHAFGHPSNGITKLYAHLLTAKLNIIAFANPDDVSEAIAMADAFLAQYDWNDWGMLTREQKQDVGEWKGKLEQYNEGYIGPGSCGDDEGDDDSGYHSSGYGDDNLYLK